MPPSPLTAEIAAAAARLIVEEGMEYGPAKRRAAKLVAPRTRGPVDLPDNTLVEDEVRAYIDLFCADTQPGELAALRAVALRWMLRLGEFEPHLTGAVWNGTATRHSDVWINLFCDDSKSVEIGLLNLRIPYDVGQTIGFRGETVDVLTVSDHHDALDQPVLVHLSLYDRDDLRGALRRDARGRAERGPLAAVQALITPPDPTTP
ncbi:hypothetical protein [Caldimonas caldifontis]|uniref:UDP-N-acetylmuramate--alanine ligase n=1 Tax=Caldimonas caldifontis TaxID=1452508 RepID=A0A2S5SYW6_9BURK|nr:hypothetical protein [Caldimonas caldifontis]PPE67941.1 hypothetical protein C1704_00195 [Caldimonas caldifontis]